MKADFFRSKFIDSENRKPKKVFPEKFLRAIKPIFVDKLTEVIADFQYNEEDEEESDEEMSDDEDEEMEEEPEMETEEEPEMETEEGE